MATASIFSTKGFKFADATSLFHRYNLSLSINPGAPSLNAAVSTLTFILGHA